MLNKVVRDDCLLDAKFYFGVSISNFLGGREGGRGKQSLLSSSCKILAISALEMGGYNPMNMNMNMSLGHLAAMNPFFLSQNGAFLNQLLGQSGMNAAMHQGWAGGLSGKTVSQLWMNDETKVGCLLS